ncbi:hypothetical protein B484DRAFT_471982 [Ochromonadaceae sp. CCMP2298]|nr:hypothetical protein B484DRAFT_471982 [Ochromonadaceae sp. CCMP2298]
MVALLRRTILIAALYRASAYSSGRAPKIASHFLSLSRPLSSQSGPTVTGLIGPSCTDRYYAQQLDFPAALQGFTQAGVMWAAVEADIQALEITPEEYIGGIDTSSDQFFSKGALFDEDMLATLRKALEDKGTFALLLGGGNTGKLKLLRILAEEYNKAGEGPIVVVVDMHMAQSDAFEAGCGLPGHGNMGRAVSKINMGEVTAMEAIKGFVAAANKCGRMPCILVDQADIAFAVRTQEDKIRASDILHLFTALSKQDHALNVLLTSSEYLVFPFRLQQDVDFSLGNIGEVVFAGELPSASMRKLLVEEWGLGPGLSDLCLAAYGGNVYYTAKALSKLSCHKQDFAADDVVSASVYNAIVNCLDAEIDHPDMTDLLCELTVTGFAAIDDVSDPRADMMAAKRVAGVVTQALSWWGFRVRCGAVAPSMD